jgi:hypothetical protein
MCHSQILKVLNGFEVWKKLPNPTNKQKIEKATKFESSLANLVNRNIKITINAMKNCSIMGK